MKKKANAIIKSDVKCANPNCNKFLKLNVVVRKPTAYLCYDCFRSSSARTRPIRTAREVRHNPELRSIKRWTKLIPLKGV